MRDLFIKSTSLDAFKGDFPQFVTEEGDLITASLTHALCHVGKIVDTPGTYDEEGNQITAPTFVDGEHFNLRLLDDSLAASIQSTANTEVLDPEPATPAVVWG
jgi:hypothetical protein